MIKLLLLNAALWAEDAHHAAAAAHGDAHAVDIPWLGIFVQSFNLGLLILLLGFLLRKTVKAYFEHRARDYNQLVARAETAKREAERGHREISERLNQLEAGAEQGLAQARREADELKARMAKEAQALSEKLAEEAKRSAKAEAEKAKAQLRAELLTEAIAASRENLKTTLGSSEQKRLQNEFVEKIQVVGG
ncbi:MAG TPA: hypothetical protein PKC28_00305 [Bdellovibrionales bacterium]|nr:hypothetical protein [Bdellovibrionales bacterium]